MIKTRDSNSRFCFLETLIMSQLWKKFASSSTRIKIALLAAGAIWSVFFTMIIVGVVLLLGTLSQAQSPSSNETNPTIRLEPASGMVNTPMIVQGLGWSPDSTVLIYLAAADERGGSGPDAGRA
jgi:hypothetical protein